MLLLTFTVGGQQRICNLADIFKHRTVILMGGAPTITELPLYKLEQRGVLSAAINNAAIHFAPTCWFSADHPKCFEPQILRDPNIMKFSPAGHSGTVIDDDPYRDMPNMYFYVGEPDVPIGQALAEHTKTPWYRNSLLISLVLLNYMGVSRIILGGSDFEFSDKVYGHDDSLAPHERKLNKNLYTSQVFEFKRLKSVFDESGIEILDCSVKSKMEGVYPVISFDEAIELALEGFPESMVDPKTLAHGTRFAPAEMKKELGIPDVDPDAPVDDMESVL